MAVGRRRTTHGLDAQRTKLTGCERTARKRRRRGVRVRGGIVNHFQYHSYVRCDQKIFVLPILRTDGYYRKNTWLLAAIFIVHDPYRRPAHAFGIWEIPMHAG